MDDVNRRRMLKQAALIGSGVSSIGLAGCTSNSQNGSGGNSQNGSGGNSQNGSGGNSQNGSGGNADVHMEIASVLSEGNAEIIAMNRFKKLIEQETNNAFSVKISPGGSYGSAKEISEICSQGGVEAWAGGSYPWQESVPAYGFVSAPFIMTDFKQVQDLFASDLMKPAYEKLRENSNQIPVGGPQYWGKRNLATKKKRGAVHKASQVKNLSLRLPKITSWVKTWSKIGASPTPVSWDEVYSALQTGTVDAVEAPQTSMNSAKLYEVTQFYNLTQHQVQFGELFINADFFENLDETYQKLVREMSTKANKYANKDTKNKIGKINDKFASSGMKIVKDVDRESFQKAAKPALENLFDNKWKYSLKKIRNV